MAKKVGDWYEYTGAIHMHTTESDGTKPIEEVIAIGRHCGLDFMLFTDHMTLSNRDAGHEGIYGRTLVLIGYEHNDKDDKHHYLLFDSPHVYPEDMTVTDYVASGARDGALGILAHPDEIRSPEGRYPPYPWVEWNADGFNGIELWNQMSEWMERLTPSNKVLMAFSPRRSMVGPTDRILRRWDDINSTRKCVGVAGVDAHAFPIPVGPFTVEIFPYKVHFRSLRTHVLLSEPMSDDIDTARSQLFEALRDCRVFGSNLRWGNAESFRFEAQSGAEKVTIGGHLSSVRDARLSVSLPTSAEIRLVHDGHHLIRANSAHLEYSVQQSGLYRVEAWIKGRCWIFSNHIRIGQ